MPARKKPDITLIWDKDVRTWKGDIPFEPCLITGEPSFIFDVYKDEGGKDVLISANASYKIQNFIRQRSGAGVNRARIEVVIYGKKVTIIDGHQAKQHEGIV